MRPGSKQPGDPPLTRMPGLVDLDDVELAVLMQTAGRLPRESVHALLRHVYRAALSYERTGDPAYLTCLAADALATMRLHADPDYQGAVREARDAPRDPGEAIDVHEMLARHGL